MDSLSRYQICDAYLVSSLSIAFVSLFVYLRPRDPWSEERWLKALVAGWAVLEIVALVLSVVSAQENRQGNIELPQALEGSIHIILATISMWGVANIQVSFVT